MDPQPNYTISFVKKSIFVTFQFEALHKWGECPLPEVNFLRDVHRHIFHVRMEKNVSHSNRDVEFIMWKRAILDYVREHWDRKDLGNMSCEHMAETLGVMFDAKKVEVSEDGENGAIYESVSITDQFR